VTRIHPSKSSPTHHFPSSSAKFHPTFTTRPCDHHIEHIFEDKTVQYDGITNQRQWCHVVGLPDPIAATAVRLIRGADIMQRCSEQSTIYNHEFNFGSCRTLCPHFRSRDSHDVHKRKMSFCGARNSKEGQETASLDIFRRSYTQAGRQAVV
jgi:hypothetical protein